MNQFPKGIIDFCIDLLYPKRCITCDKVLLKIEKEIGFCKSCAKKVKLVGDNYCLKCGATVDVQTQYCVNCSKNQHEFHQNRAVFRYDGDMKNAMYRFKYSNRRCYGKVFAWHTAKKYGSWIKSQGFDVIIPVPMYKPKERVRGYNQAEVFAKALGCETGIPVETKIVRRERDTVAMKQLNRAKRKKNLLNAFMLAENVVQFRKVLIVDDIYTTGTTLDEVTKVLKAGGVKEVYGLCICIGEMQ